MPELILTISSIGISHSYFRGAIPNRLTSSSVPAWLWRSQSPVSGLERDLSSVGGNRWSPLQRGLSKPSPPSPYCPSLVSPLPAKDTSVEKQGQILLWNTLQSRLLAAFCNLRLRTYCAKSRPFQVKEPLRPSFHHCNQYEKCENSREKPISCCKSFTCIYGFADSVNPSTWTGKQSLFGKHFSCK